MILDKIFKNSDGELISFFDFIKGSNSFQNYIYTLAEAHAIDLIAKTIAKCEVQTFELKNKKIQKSKGDLYWTLNIQPNHIENGTAFLYKLMTKLLADRNALVLINKTPKTNLLYVADSYNATSDILKGKIFKDIMVTDNEGNSINLYKTYSSDNSIYFSLGNENLMAASNQFKTNTGKILKAAQKSFINGNTAKWRLKNPSTQYAMRDLETGEDLDYAKYKEKITDGLFSEEEAVVLLSEMFDLINLNKDTKSNSDYLSVVKEIGDAVAQKWNVPLEIFYGNKTDKSTSNEDFVTFAVDPYFELLEDGFNSSLVGKESYLKGEYVKFNKLNITHKDLIDKASGWDKLISNGFSFNQLSELLGLPTIDEDWANEHYITKNYANVRGGEEENER